MLPVSLGRSRPRAAILMLALGAPGLTGCASDAAEGLEAGWRRRLERLHRKAEAA